MPNEDPQGESVALLKPSLGRRGVSINREVTRPMKSNPRLFAVSVGLATLLAFSLGALPSPAQNWDDLPPPNADWTQTDKYPSSTHYYDRNSVRINGNLRYFWRKVTSEVPKNPGDSFILTTLQLMVLDCSSRKISEIRYIFLNIQGRVLGSSAQPLRFENEYEEVEMNAVCSPGTHRGTEDSSTVGSGFVVSSAGMVLTNAHVVSGCEVIRVTTAGGSQRTASLVAADPQSDLALLGSKGGFSSVAGFRVGRPLRLAEEIVALGYPLHGLLASGVNVSTGTVSALAGIANDSTKVQISAPVQPGNSGGPVLDLSGAIVGIVVAKLDAIKMAKAIGDIPQNVNFAIKADVARLFLEAQGVTLQSAQAGVPRQKADVAAIGREFTVLVECLKGQDAK